jgi:uncharacterized protein DUF1707
MSRRATLRASDADRERIAERLRNATAEGRLLAEELEERLERTFAARTYGELDAVVADLPGAAVRPRERPQTAVWLRPLPMFFALVLLAPVLFSVLLAAAVVMATLFSTWIVVVIVGWWLFGHRYRHRGPGRHPMHPYGRWPTGRPGGPRPRPWV